MRVIWRVEVKPFDPPLLILIFLISVTQLSGMKLFLYNYTDSLPPGIDLKEDKKTKQRTIASPSRQRTDITEVEPKVLLPYEQIPGKISRKTAIEKLKEIYKQYSIETLIYENKIPLQLS